MAHAPTTAIFPGTFDPITNGHLDVIRRGQHLFDRLIVAIGHSPGKKELFTASERLQMIRQIIDTHGIRAEAHAYHGLTVDFAQSVGATVILRGLRNVSDLAYEFQLALTNRAVADIETVFVMSGDQYGFTSSTLIKQIASVGHLDRLKLLLPSLVIERLERKKPVLSELYRDGLKE